MFICCTTIVIIIVMQIAKSPKTCRWDCVCLAPPGDYYLAQGPFCLCKPFSSQGCPGILCKPMENDIRG